MDFDVWDEYELNYTVQLYWRPSVCSAQQEKRFYGVELVLLHLIYLLTSHEINRHELKS